MMLVDGDSQIDMDLDADGDADECSDCKACLGMHRAHTCSKRDTGRLGMVAKLGTAVVKRKVVPPPPPLPAAAATPKESCSAGSGASSGTSNRARAKPKFKVPTMKELSSYQIGCHLGSDESPFTLVQCLCAVDHWVVYKTHQELDGVERTLDVRSPLDAKLLRRLKAERGRLQPTMSDAAASSAPRDDSDRERSAFCSGCSYLVYFTRLPRRDFPRVDGRVVWVVPACTCLHSFGGECGWS